MPFTVPLLVVVQAVPFCAMFLPATGFTTCAVFRHRHKPTITSAIVNVQHADRGDRRKPLLGLPTGGL